MEPMRTRKLLTALGVFSIVLLVAVASPAVAGKGHKRFKCDGVFTGLTVRDVVVPRDGACTLTDSTVKGKVRVLGDAYFQATGSSIRKDVEGDGAQTIFIDTGSRVRGDIDANKTIQLYVYNSTVRGDIGARGATDTVQVCGNTVQKGDIKVRKSGTDILIGDPLAIGCPGNSVKRGDVRITENFTDVELVVSGNTLGKGSLKVSGNTGPAGKFVQSNEGGDTLSCKGNDSPFTASGNSGWLDEKGQCGGP